MGQPCGFPGNSDLYGLGIRIGIYLQWITSQVAVYFHLEGSNDLSDNYLIFTIALMIAIFVITAEQLAYPVEIVIVLYMFFGGLLSVRGYRPRKKNVPTTVWRALLGFAVFVAMTAYGSWFWVTGREGDRFIEPPCGTVVFLFGKIPATSFGRASTFFAVVSIYYTVGMPIMILYMYHHPILTFFQGKMNWRGQRSRPDEPSYTSSKQNFMYSVNRDFKSSLEMLLVVYCGVAFSSATSAYLEDAQFDQLSVSTLRSDIRFTILIMPPVSSYYELMERLGKLREQAKILRSISGQHAGEDRHSENELSIGGESETTSVLGRLRASYRHALGGFRCYRSRRNQGGAVWIVSTFSWIALIYSVIAVELTIKWNGIVDVYSVKSAGQLIPLVIGIAGLLKTGSDIRKKYSEKMREKKEKDEEAGMSWGYGGSETREPVVEEQVVPCKEVALDGAPPSEGSRN